MHVNCAQKAWVERWKKIFDISYRFRVVFSSQFQTKFDGSLDLWIVDSLSDCFYGFVGFLVRPVFCGIQCIAFRLNVKLMHELIFVFCKIVVDKNYFIFGSIGHRASFPSEINAINSCIEYQKELRNSICLYNIQNAMQTICKI